MLANPRVRMTQKVARRSRLAPGRAKSPAHSIDGADQPLRGEAYSAEHLTDHAARLASAHRVTTRPSGDRRFADRFADNSRFIAATYNIVTLAVRDGES